MSLLTNEQLAELIGIASNQSTSRDLHDEFHEWNEKQTGNQVNVNWNDAPENAVQAILNTFWVDKNGVTFGVYKEYYNRPKPVITPHPHAEMIMKYAEVAARRIDPWVEFEIFMIDDQEWVANNGPLYFIDSCQYRHIGETK
jgi:hypothetical protein